MMVGVSSSGQASSELDLRATRGALRVGLVSDTHGLLDEQIAGTLAGCDVILHAGDVGASAVLDELRETGARVLAVRGNNDTPDKWIGGPALPKLPVCARLRLPGGDVAIEHGDAHPARTRHARLRAAHVGARAVVYGHSHRLVVDDEASIWVVNPGAAGRARTYGGPSCLLLLAEGGRWSLSVHRFERAPTARRGNKSPRRR